MKRVTLADIAAQVGVSAKTVSNVVNGTGWVGDDTRERIVIAVRELGYRPNLAARQLRNGASGILALAIPDLREPYFAEFASRFVSIAQQRSITVLISQTGGKRAAELACIEGEGLPALDGLVLSPLELTAEDLALRRSTQQVVMIGEHGASIAGTRAIHIGVDNVAAAAAATAHLISHGRRRIAAVGVQFEGSTATSRLRFEGYQRALAAAGIKPDQALLCPVTGFNRAEGALAVEALISSGVPVDGLVCFNDTLALGALYTLGVHGIAVPRDVEVIGFDDIEEGRFFAPAFATIDPGVDETACAILDVLSRRDKDTAPVHNEVPFTLVERP